MLMSFYTFLRKMQQAFSRDEWLARLLGLSLYHGDPEDRGLVLIQIDALSHRLLTRALEDGQMPFLKSLIDSGRYRLLSTYSGMPCCTPAVQAELFYGVPGSIPSFQFLDRQTRRIFTMHTPWDASEMEKRLSEQGRGLMEGGSCYSNIFTGGAAEPHFSIASLGLAPIFARRQAYVFLLGVLLHVFSLLRIVALLVVEFFLAIIDFFRGITRGRDLWKELRFVPSRAAMIILLREIIYIGVRMDIARGLPIIQCNFMGYHDTSHRRGATSRFARWTLGGIDYTIKRIARAAFHNQRRRYDVWIYSDHGQEDTVPYRKVKGVAIQDKVAEILKEIAVPARRDVADHQVRFLRRMGFRKKGTIKDLLPIPVEENQVAVTSLSQVVSVYIPMEMGLEEKIHVATEIREKAGVPTIFIPHGSSQLLVLPPKGKPYELREHPRRLFPAGHCMLDRMVEDFIACCSREDAAQLILCGWGGKGKTYYTFMLENGSHGGVGPDETTPFALLPVSVPLADHEKQCLRPLDLRKKALEFLKR